MVKATTNQKAVARGITQLSQSAKNIISSAGYGARIFFLNILL